MMRRRDELGARRAPGGLRRLLRGLAITCAVVLVATAAVPAVGVVIAAVFWLLLASLLGVAAAAAAGPIRRWAPAAAGHLVATSARLSSWSAAHRPRWLDRPVTAATRLTTSLLTALRTALRTALLAVAPRAVRRRRHDDLVPAIAVPRAPLAALPPAESHRNRDRERRNRAA